MGIRQRGKKEVKITVAGEDISMGALIHIFLNKNENKLLSKKSFIFKIKK